MVNQEKVSPLLRLWQGNIAGLVQSITPKDHSTLPCLTWAEELNKYAPWERVHLAPQTGEPNWWLPRQDMRGAGPITVNLCGPCSSSLDVGWFFEEHNLLKDFDSVIAMSQWSGRGQFRRKWLSPPGNLYLAWALPKAEGETWERISSLLVGLVLVRAWEHLGLSLMLKWPNDLVLAGQKAGGILLEQRKDRLLAGIGLNLYQAPKLDILQNVSSMQAAAFDDFIQVPGPLTLWLLLVHQAVSCYLQMLGSESPGSVLRQIESVLAFKNENVWVTAAHDFGYPARVLGLDAKGGLRLESQGEIKVINSGSISPC